MEEEIKNLIKVWFSVIASLSYCYFIVTQIPKGKLRLLSLLPIFYIFSILPLTFSSIHFRGISAFFLTWLANFKLLLFSFHQGPLIPHLHSFLQFISTASLPIKSKDESNPCPPSGPHSHMLGPTIKGVLLGLVVYMYRYKHQMHDNVVLGLYCLHIYLALEVVLAIGAALVRATLGMVLEPQSNEPYLSSSLQDFWGRRWNLMVTSILRPTVYDPVRLICRRRVGERWAQLAGVMATFVVSGLMHELIFYYFTSVGPTWEVTWFFVLHGFCTGAEVVVKKGRLTGTWRLPRAVSGFLTLGFIVVTGFWLFFPQIVRSGVDEKVIEEYACLVRVLEKKGWI